MGMFNAGLPVSPIGLNLLYQIGDLKPLLTNARPKWFRDSGQEWLYTGTLRANTGNAYFNLLAVSPGNGVNFLAAADRIVTQASPPKSGANPQWGAISVLWDGNNYCAVPSCAEDGGGASVQVGATLSAMTINNSLSAFGMCGYCQVAPGGRIVFACNDATSGLGLRYLSAGGAIVNGSATARAYGGVASNGSNLCVAFARASASNAANSLQTSVDGAAWTARTGSSALLNGGIYGIHYSGALVRFFKWGLAGTGFGILSTTDGFTDTVAMASNAAYLPHDTINNYKSGYQHGAASTPGATLLPARRVSDNMWGWLRTTDGTTWNFVSPFLDPAMRAPGGSSVLAGNEVINLLYDAPRSRLVAWMGNSRVGMGDFPSYYYSLDDGATWTAGPCLLDEDAAATLFSGLSVANGQDLMFTGLTGDNRLKYIYPGSKLANVASHVGTVTAYAQTPGITYAVRIK